MNSKTIIMLAIACVDRGASDAGDFVALMPRNERPRIRAEDLALERMTVMMRPRGKVKQRRCAKCSCIVPEQQSRCHRCGGKRFV